MAIVNPSLPTIGGQRGDGESALRSDVVAILAELNGNLDTTNVRDASLRATDMDSGATVTSLPPAPYDGQEISFVADATNGIVWRFKYRAASASAFKWEYIGGSELVSDVQAGVTTASGSFVSLAGGPSVVAPLAGDYDATIFFQVNAGGLPVGAVKFGAVAGFPADAESGISRVSTGAEQSPSRAARASGVAAGATIEVQYREGSGVGTSGFFRRIMYVKPVRVG